MIPGERQGIEVLNQWPVRVLYDDVSVSICQASDIIQRLVRYPPFYQLGERDLALASDYGVYFRVLLKAFL